MANVVIGTVADDKVDTEWVSSLLWLLNAHVKDFRNRVIVTRGYIGRLDRGRQAVAQVFMESTDADYLLSIDSDMVFTPKHYELLLEGAQNMDGESIVSGIYPKEDGTLTAQKENEGIMSAVSPNEVANSKGRWFEVDGIGMGFCLIPRKVFEKLEAPYYSNYTKNDAGQILADDTSFCWKARKEGTTIWIDKKVQVGHLKSVAMGTNIPESPLDVPEGGLIIP